MHGFLPELTTTTRPSTSILSLFFTASLRVGWVGDFATWQVVVAALSPRLLNRILYLTCHFPRVAQSLRNSFTLISQCTESQFSSFQWGIYVSKAGIADYTRQAFPSQESWRLLPDVCVKESYPQGRGASDFWEKILQAPHPLWVISHRHRLPTLWLGCLQSFVLERLGLLYSPWLSLSWQKQPLPPQQNWLREACKL